MQYENLLQVRVSRSGTTLVTTAHRASVSESSCTIQLFRNSTLLVENGFLFKRQSEHSGGMAVDMLKQGSRLIIWGTDVCEPLRRPQSNNNLAGLSYSDWESLWHRVRDRACQTGGLLCWVDETQKPLLPLITPLWPTSDKYPIAMFLYNVKINQQKHALTYINSLLSLYGAGLS